VPAGTRVTAQTKETKSDERLGAGIRALDPGGDQLTGIHPPPVLRVARDGLFADVPIFAALFYVQRGIYRN